MYVTTTMIANVWSLRSQFIGTSDVQTTTNEAPSRLRLMWELEFAMSVSLIVDLVNLSSKAQNFLRAWLILVVLSKCKNVQFHATKIPIPHEHVSFSQWTNPIRMCTIVILYWFNHQVIDAWLKPLRVPPPHVGSCP